jgi:3-keto-5-aminohexanoate cleavage enzyme
MNEFTSKDVNPHVPWSPEEIAEDAAACVAAGASIVHFHGRDHEGGQSADAGLLAETLQQISGACDAVTMCTLGAGTGAERDARLATLTDAAVRPDLAPVDLGSFNLDPYDAGTRSFRTEEGLYVNTVGTVRYLTEGILAAGVLPAAICWSVGSMRLLGALLDQGLWPARVYAELVLSERMLSVHPATPEGLEALHGFLPDRPVTWAAECSMGSVLPMVEWVVAAGGGLAFGLGDHPYGELGTPTNAEVVAAVVGRLRDLGRRPATPDEVREALGQPMVSR